MERAIIRERGEWYEKWTESRTEGRKWGMRDAKSEGGEEGCRRDRWTDGEREKGGRKWVNE